MKPETKQDLVGNLAWGVGLMALALACTQARRMGVIEPETVTRVVTGAIGLMLAWMGNRIPKAFVPNAAARRVRRVAGWSMAISGLVYAGLFGFAPLSLAYPAGCGAVVIGIAVTIGYCMSLRAKAKAA